MNQKTHIGAASWIVGVLAVAAILFAGYVAFRTFRKPPPIQYAPTFPIDDDEQWSGKGPRGPETPSTNNSSP